MKKFVILLASILTLGGSILAERKPINVQGYRSLSHGSIGQIKRVPAYLPITVYYDDEIRQVEIVADESLEPGEAVFYDNFNQFAYSSVLNCTVTLPLIVEGSVTIEMSGTDWDATTRFSITNE